MRYKIYSIIILILIFSSVLFSQEDTTEVNEETENIDTKCCSKHNYYDEDFEIDIDVDMDFDILRKTPAISFSYQISDLNRKDISKKNLIDPVGFELKLGTIQQKNVFEKDDLIKENFKYFLISNYSSYLIKNSTNKINNDTWKFGFGKQRGYGYKLNNSFTIIPYTEASGNWSRINFAFDPNSISENDRKIFQLYDESFRFGSSNQGGIKVKILNSFAIDFAYERQIIFQRLLFWKWAGSAIIEAASHSLLDKFIKRIFKSSPYAAPIALFVLKNALSFGIYELREEKMNWPFNSEPPISFDQFKIGINFIF